MLCQINFVDHNLFLLGFLSKVDGVDRVIDDEIMTLHVVLKVDLVNVYSIYQILISFHLR